MRILIGLLYLWSVVSLHAMDNEGDQIGLFPYSPGSQISTQPIDEDGVPESQPDSPTFRQAPSGPDHKVPSYTTHDSIGQTTQGDTNPEQLSQILRDLSASAHECPLVVPENKHRLQ